MISTFNLSSLFERSFCFEPNKELIIKLNDRFKKDNSIEIIPNGVGDKIEEKNFITNDKGKTLSQLKDRMK